MCKQEYTFTSFNYLWNNKTLKHMQIKAKNGVCFNYLWNNKTLKL